MKKLMHLAGQTQAALEEWAVARGARPGGARVAARASLAELAQGEVRVGPAEALLAQARTAFSTELPRAEAVADPDGPVRFAVRLEDGQVVETVLIYHPSRWTVCVSSQAGCARGCVFCETGRLGLQRNLTAAEIVGQYAIAPRYLKTRPRNLGFMGIGQRLHNLHPVLPPSVVLRRPH